MLPRWISVLTLLCLLAPVVRAEESASPAAAPPPVSGIDLSAMDRSVRPQDDFYDFVNGTWLRETEMPADRSRLSTFSLLDDRAQEQIQAILEQAAQSQAPLGSPRQKLGDLYRSVLDTSTREELGLRPLRARLDRIARLSTPEEVAAELGRLRVLHGAGPISFSVYPDAGDPGRYGLWLGQGGLTMPDRDHYLQDDARSQELRRAFVGYASGLLERAGYPDSQERAQRLLALETRLAEIQTSRVESRDAQANYNPRSVSQLQQLLSGFPWVAFARASQLDRASQVIVRNYPYFERWAEVFSQTDLATWKDYLILQTLDRCAPALSDDFESMHFGFHQTTLQGVPEQRPRWKRAVDTTSSVLGELLGQEYVRLHFSPQAKQRMETLVQNLLSAYRESIVTLPWMSPPTKERALEKLALFRPKIGYPDRWRDYTGLTIEPDDLIGNLHRSAEFENAFQTRRIGAPVDPVDWGMTPQTVNAYFSPTRNEIVFPAAILQPPFFNLEADDAVNYGAIGAVIGHEIGHGFDDQGSKYDGHGRLQSWWTEEDRSRFEALGDRLVNQYEEFEPLPGQRINGRLTLGENIGDLAGLSVAYQAYLASLQGSEPPVLDGFTGPQRFFIGWAQVWRGKIREEALRQRLLTDPHSPARFRVLGPLPHLDGFYSAFGVQESDRLYRPIEQRVRIW